MNHIFLAGLLVSLVGCSGIPTICEKPFGAIGFGHKLPTSDPLVLPENEGGDNPTAIFEAGCDYKKGYSLYLRHQSQWFDGGPFNSRAEVYMDSLEFKKKWGGI